MKQKCFSIASILALLVIAAACEQKNSVTAPTGVIGTTASEKPVRDEKTGATISSPQLASPPANKQFRFLEQPVVLTIINGVTTGSVALTYTFEVATDSGFASKVYSKDVAEGSGQTSVTIDKLAAAKVYFWRARSNSGSTVGPNSGTRSFEIGAEPILQVPVLASPGANETISDKATLVLNNSQRSGPVGAVEYRFEISELANFSSLFYTATVPENRGATVTSHLVPAELAEKTYWWRARAMDPDNGLTTNFAPGVPFKYEKAKLLDLRTANIVIGPQNIADWPTTAQITSAYFDPFNEQLCIFHTRLNVWPPSLFNADGTTVEGNQWVFALIDGQWWGGAADWYRPGQACKGVNAQSIGRDAFYQTPNSPAYRWQPVSGEVFAVIASTPARAWPAFATYDERSDIAYITWP